MSESSEENKPVLESRRDAGMPDCLENMLTWAEKTFDNKKPQLPQGKGVIQVLHRFRSSQYSVDLSQPKSLASPTRFLQGFYIWVPMYQIRSLYLYFGHSV